MNNLPRFIIFFLLLSGTIFMTTTAEATPTKSLPPCLNTPNCVSSQAKDEQHYIAPFKISGNPLKAWEEFRKEITQRKRMIITHETETTLHAEATSLVFHFVDDIDAILDVDAGLIHIRSASRIGHSDFGVNRKRIETFREQLRKMRVLG
jgi:uncharacterized protein (DUF1499 family)